GLCRGAVLPARSRLELLHPGARQAIDIAEAALSHVDDGAGDDLRHRIMPSDDAELFADVLESAPHHPDRVRIECLALQVGPNRHAVVPTLAQRGARLFVPAGTGTHAGLTVICDRRRPNSPTARYLAA